WPPRGRRGPPSRRASRRLRWRRPHPGSSPGAAMRVTIVGAGAVGAVLGISLEHQKHEVMYLLRKGRKRDFRSLMLIDAQSGAVRRRDAPMALEVGSRLPPFEWALLCVRGDQLEEGARTVAAHCRPDAMVGVATAAVDALARVRAIHDGPVFSIVPLF